MSNVPYLYVNLLALCCFALLFITFLAAKKTPEIRAFLVVMLGFIFWTGGSILMRLQVFPGVDFWYYVSILSLFSLALLIYFFVCSFVRDSGYFLKILWSVLTVALLAVTATGRILAPPAVDTLPGGGVVFRYSMGWPVVIPFLAIFLIVLSIARLFLTVIRTKGRRAPGVMQILIGCVTVGLGNLLQLIPGNVFPWDTLSGILFALLLVDALYKKRMFRLTLLVSRSVLMLACALVCLLAASYCVEPLQTFLTDVYHIPDTTAVTINVVLFACLLVCVYWLVKKLIDALFTREEQQGKLLKSFSAGVSQSLNTEEIAAKLAAILKSEIPVAHVYICLPQDGGFAARYSSEPLDRTNFSLSAASPCLKSLREGETYIILDEFRRDPLYLSVWQTEKALLRSYSIGCIAALRDGGEIVGLVLLSDKDRGAGYTYSEMSFLETVVSIASIALKNAGLYEQMYREARIDSLTGVYNYRYFVEKLNTEYNAAGDGNLALMYVDIDDFKLYNQLYGACEGDRVLRRVTEVLLLCVGSNGTVFRSSGKVFAALLPGFDGHRVELLANEIRRRVSAINDEAGHTHQKRLSVSCGVCISPHAASSAKELMENADLAVYNAKNAGKDCVVFFKAAEPVSQRIAGRAMSIIEQHQSGDSAYQSNSSAIFALTAAIDAKDHYTYKHSHNVARYSAVLATAAGLNDDQISIIYESALLHDIGKISIPESILGKTGRLTSDEYETMKGHVNSAIEMIRYLPNMDYVIPAAIGHHERWDGRGYPRGLSGPAIPVSARCLALADAYDAMTTDRPYHKALAPEYAAEQIEKCAGTQFDPELSIIFVRLIRSGELTPMDEGAPRGIVPLAAG